MEELDIVKKNKKMLAILGDNLVINLNSECKMIWLNFHF